MTTNHMNYIFLDIDGVLNSEPFMKMHIYDKVSIDESKIKLLSKIVKECDAKIILTSSRRITFTKNLKPKDNNRTAKELIRLLNKYEISLFARTKIYDVDWDKALREEEIREYINKNLTKDDNYIILDDEDFHKALYNFENHFILINYQTGLTTNDVIHAIEILNSNN